MKYTEGKDLAQKYKEEYVKGIENIIASRKKVAEKIRKEYTANIFLQQEGYREDFKRMLGWPLVDYHIDDIPLVKSDFLAQEQGYKIFRMQFEILEGVYMTGLFFKQDSEDKKPLVIVQHGGLGTPEFISGIYGNTGNYNDMLERVGKYDVHIFAPQLLLWSEAYNVKFDRVKIDASLKRVGSSVTAIEVFGIMRILDYFEEQNYVSSFGMVGLSYGGFYTLYVTAVDTRIKSAISCSFFNKRDEVDWPDWTWFESANKFDDAEIACLIYPRKLHIAMGNKDELFCYKHSIDSFERIKEMCKEVGTKWISLDIFDGIHEFFKDDEPIGKLVNDLV